MKQEAVPPAWSYRLAEEFERVRGELGLAEGPDRLQTRVSHWVLSTDRHFPRVFLGRTLAEILETPFDELLATPGVGPKKLDLLFAVLRRAAGTRISTVARTDRRPPLPAVDDQEPNPQSIDKPTAVNEALWDEWRATMTTYGLGPEPLARFVASMRDLPRTLWRVRLATYLHLSLKELNELPSHGERRITTVVETIRDLHDVLARLRLPPHLAVNLGPRFVEPLQGWVLDALQRRSTITADELRSVLISPLVEQVRTDAGEKHAAMALLCLGSKSPKTRALADRLGVVRSRLYELQADVALMIEIRWPMGQFLVPRLHESITTTGEPAALDVLDAAMSFFFPSLRPDAGDA